MAGVGGVIWKIAVALYLMATGVLAVTKNALSDLNNIFISVFSADVGILVVIAGVIAIVAGILILLEMFNIQVPILDTLILIIAIIWVVFIVFLVVYWIGAGFTPFWYTLQTLGVYIMVLGSLLVASKKFG